MLQQHQTPNIPGQKVIVMNHQKVGYATPIVPLSSPSNKPQPNTSLLLSSLQNSKPKVGVGQNTTSMPQPQNQQTINMSTPTISNSANSEIQLGASPKLNSVLASNATLQTIRAGGIQANQMSQIDGTEGSGSNERLSNHIPKISGNNI